MNTTEEKEITPQSQSGYAPVNGIKMYYEIHGEGTPLVLIHGGGSTINTSFGRVLPLFAKNFKVIAVELQAHGHTSDRDGPVSFEQDADDVAALLDYLKISKAHLLGFSNGGSTAMQVAIRHPALVNKLVIISAVYKREGMIPGFFDFMENASLANMPQPLQSAYLEITGDQKGLQNMHDKDKERMLHFKDWNDEDLLSIKAPALVIAADKDVVMSEHTLQISKNITGSKLMILPGIHGALIGEICADNTKSQLPVMTTTIISEFLNEALTAPQ